MSVNGKELVSAFLFRDQSPHSLSITTPHGQVFTRVSKAAKGAQDSWGVPYPYDGYVLEVYKDPGTPDPTVDVVQGEDPDPVPLGPPRPPNGVSASAAKGAITLG